MLYVLIRRKSNQGDMLYVRFIFQCELSAPVIVAYSVDSRGDSRGGQQLNHAVASKFSFCALHFLEIVEKTSDLSIFS